MSEFWLWFWRPIAETLGVIAMIALVCAVWIVFTALSEWGRKRKKKA